MSKFTIETLTPVHIGSGTELQRGIDYLVFNKEEKIGILDDRKVLGIIGEENIDRWVSNIMAERDLSEYLQQRKPGFSSCDVSLREVYIFSEKDVNSVRTLKEHMLDARLDPYIPGSSLKGSIRTAIFSYLLKKNKINIPPECRDIRKTATYLEKHVFGRDPNNDLLRFLHVSDIGFDCYTVALLMRTLNYQRNGWEFKNSVNQLVEAIGQEETSRPGTMNIPVVQMERYLNDLKGRDKVNMDLVEILTDNKLLFRTINEHTITLLDQEIHIWSDPEIGSTMETDQYLKNLQALKKKTQHCNERECVIRTGFGSGWRFMTGGWANIDSGYFSEDEWVRLKSQLSKRDAPYFPKTRKMDIDSDILGFIKITMQ